jgi:hypothetical protein
MASATGRKALSNSSPHQVLAYGRICRKGPTNKRPDLTKNRELHRPLGALTSLIPALSCRLPAETKVLPYRSNIQKIEDFAFEQCIAAAKLLGAADRGFVLRNDHMDSLAAGLAVSECRANPSRELLRRDYRFEYSTLPVLPRHDGSGAPPWSSKTCPRFTSSTARVASTTEAPSTAPSFLESFGCWPDIPS